MMIRRTIAAAAIIVGIFFVFRYFGDEKNYKSQNQLADISFNFSFTGNDIDPSLTKLSVETNDGVYPGEKISDSSFIIKNIPVVSTQSASIIIQNPDGNISLERPIDLKWQVFNLSIVPPALKPHLHIRYNDEEVFTNVVTQLKQELYLYNIAALQQEFTDSSRIVYYEPNQKSKADSIVDIIKKSLGLHVKTEFIEEIRIPAATPILYLNLTGPCATISISSLPASLNEIWKGKTSNRLATIDLSKRLIYYSTGDKSTYGTYVIDEICRTNTGSYKIITTANNQYKIFFFRVSDAQSFDLSVCEDFLIPKNRLLILKKQVALNMIT